MLCIQGDQVLDKIWTQFRIRYVEKNPGCNGNDVDRAFLHAVVDGILMVERIPIPKTIVQLISTIR